MIAFQYGRDHSYSRMMHLCRLPEVECSLSATPTTEKDPEVPTGPKRE